MSAIPGVGVFAGDPEEWPNPNAELALAETTPARALIEADTRAIAERIFNGLAERAPGWVAHDANLEVWLIEEFAAVAAEIRQEALNVPEAIFQTYGEEVLGIPVSPPLPAVGVSTWRAIDNRGYTIPAGSQIVVPRSGDDLVVFETVAAQRIPVGETELEGVEIHAQVPGASGNNLFGAAEVVDPLFWVDSIEVTEPTVMGDDGQSIEQYLSELIMLLRVVALRPILPWDFAVLALRVAGVGRAVAMDGYNPSDGTWGHARQVTLILTDYYGEPCPLAVKTAVSAGLEALREVNWRVLIVDADYETVDVEYEVTAFAEQDPDVVEQLCTAAVTDALQPANFRLGLTSPSIVAGEVIPPPPGIHTESDIGAWRPGRQTLRVNDIVGLLDRQRGVDWVEQEGVTLNGEAGDLVLHGPTTLPRPGAIQGIVNTQ